MPTFFPHNGPVNQWRKTILDMLPLPGSQPNMLPDPSVMLIEDDPDVGKMMQRFIERSGMKVVWAQTGAEAVRLKESFRPDVVLVDLELPDIAGAQLITWLAARRDCGIIVVSGRGSEEVERVVGIEMGADDFVSKPVPMRELVARIRAVHRRSARAPTPPPAIRSRTLMLGPVRVDLARRVVSVAAERDGAEQAIHLTAAEFTALEALIDAAPEPVAREALCRLALRRPFHAEDRGVDQLILNLRRKLFDDHNAQSVIKSVRGAGYVIAVDRTTMAASATQ